MKLESAVEAIMRASGVTLDQAKTVVYYTVMTHIKGLAVIPLLVIMGPAGTLGILTH